MAKVNFGLTKEQIVDSLTKSGIVKEKSISADELKEAIAKVIVANNDSILKCIESATKAGYFKE